MSSLKYIKIEESLMGFRIIFKPPFHDNSYQKIYENNEYSLHSYNTSLIIRNKKWKKNLTIPDNLLDMDKIFNNDNLRMGLLNFIEELMEKSDNLRMIEELSK